MVRTLHDADLDLSEDERFQRREWVVQRTAWVLAALVLTGAGAGLLGDGPVSDGRVARGGVVVEYERVGRRERPMSVQIHLPPMTGGTGGVVAADLLGAYFEHAAIESVSPRPAREEAIAGGVRYLLDAQSGEGGMVTIRLRPQGAGQRSGEVRVGAERLEISMFVYP